jgi:hypothetical protein
MLLLRECSSVFDRHSTWPIWAYVDHVLDAQDLKAAEVLASLPAAGGTRGSVRYGLTWNRDNHWLPNDATPLALTVAGLWHLGAETAPLLAAFMDTIRFLVERQRTIAPSPTEVVQATLTSHDLTDRLARLYTPADVYTKKIAELAGHEPYLWRGITPPDFQPDTWEITIPVSIRDFRETATIEDYIDTTEHLATPSEPAVQPMTAGPLDIAYAVSFTDAVWQNRTRSPLFARPDPASIARLTQPCNDHGAFNSLMSALADLLSQATVPGRAKPPRQGALEQLRRYIQQHIDAAAAARCTAAIDTLIQLREIRHSTEHGDARVKAIAAHAKLGLPYPIADWPHAWARISALTCGALDTLREEAGASLHS